MAQNEKQGMEAAAPSGSASQSGTAGSQGTSAGGQQQRKMETGTGSTTTGHESGQQSARLARRETREDALGNLFGATPFFAAAAPRTLSAAERRHGPAVLRGRPWARSGQLGTAVGRFMPNVDVEERDDRIVVRADLPGVNVDDFRVELEDDALVLQGERRDEREDMRGGVRRAERSYGGFRRVIPLPPGANLEAAEARFENGVLEDRIPFQQKSRSRRLEVQSGSSSARPPRTRPGTDPSSDSPRGEAAVPPSGVARVSTEC